MLHVEEDHEITREWQALSEDLGDFKNSPYRKVIECAYKELVRQKEEGGNHPDYAISKWDVISFKDTPWIIDMPKLVEAILKAHGEIQ